MEIKIHSEFFIKGIKSRHRRKGGKNYDEKLRVFHSN